MAAIESEIYFCVWF